MRTCIVRKSTAILSGTVYTDQENLIPANLAGATIKLTFKANPKQPDTAALITKSIGDGVTIIDEALGTFECKLLPEDTDISNRILYYEIVSTLEDETVIRSGIKIIDISENVQHE